MNSDSNSHVNELDSLRFLAIIFVLINHLGIKKDWIDWPIVTFATSPVLACVSSYLLFRNITRPIDFVGKIKNRLYSLILPYFLWTILAFVLIQGVKSIFYLLNFNISLNNPHPTWSLEVYWRNFVLLPTPGAFWYLQNLIMILPFTVLIYYLVKARWSVWLLIYLTLLAYSYHMVPFFSVRFLPYYLLGAWLGTHYKHGIPCIPGNRYFLFLSLVIIIVGNQYIPSTIGFIYFLLSFITQLTIFFLGVSVLRLFNRNPFVKYLNNKIHISFYLHAAHLLFFILIGNIFIRLFPLIQIIDTARFYFQFLASIIMFLLTYILIDLLACQMKLRTPNLFRAFSGRRHLL